MIEINLLWGLPASGKSTYAANIAQLYPYKTVILDLDRNYRDRKEMLELTYCSIQNNLFGHKKEFILDGLITTNELASEIIRYLKQSLTIPKDEALQFNIIFWPKNVEACLHNDRGRRAKNSSLTIVNLPFESPNAEVRQLANIVRRTVEMKTNAQVWADESGIRHKNMKMKSDTWSLGGEWGNCWGDRGQISAEPQPEFTEFDDILMKLCPNISFLQYKSIYNACVISDEETEHDYYGTYRNQGFYICDLNKLYDKLVELNLLITE